MLDLFLLLSFTGYLFSLFNQTAGDFSSNPAPLDWIQVIACEIVVLAATQGETSVEVSWPMFVEKTSTNHQFLGSMLVFGGVYFTPPSLIMFPPEKWWEWKTILSYWEGLFSGASC